jgi:predicted membrane metal-binding protein
MNRVVSWLAVPLVPTHCLVASLAANAQQFYPYFLHYPLLFYPFHLCVCVS